MSSTMEEENGHVILKLHTQVLRCLFLWPIEALSKRQNSFLMYGYFYLNMCCGIPVISAAGYQFYVGIEDVNILLESLIGICDIIGYSIAYICFLRYHDRIQTIIIEYNDFAKYCGNNVILETDAACIRYTKYLLCYVTLAVMFNLSWPMMSTKSCIISRGSEFYVKHDPCGMPTQNLYPFDANQRKYFWIVYPVEAIYCYHICCFFSLATATVIGFLMHITAQLKCCRYKFEHIFDKINYEEKSQNGVEQEFTHLIKYHQTILEYSQRVFSVFGIMVVVYVSVTSFSLAIIGYQIVNPKTNVQDRIRYTMLLFGWTLLFYLICFYAQQVRDESVKVGDSIYKSKWYQNGICLKVNTSLIIVLHRTQRALDFKVQYLGTMSLERFVSVIKTAYSVFTLLLTVTADE